MKSFFKKTSIKKTWTTGSFRVIMSSRLVGDATIETTIHGGLV
jgi:hypothetical protein